MKVNIVSIGNSKGIRIPKVILEQVNIKEKVELDVEKGRIILKPSRRRAREGWDKAFGLMRERGDDSLLLPDSADIEGWEW